MRLFLAAGLLCASSLAFYLPGVAPRNYEDGEPVEIKVENLDSTHTQLPYNYYSLPFCQPADIKHATENLGQVLQGDDIENSPYEVYMQQTYSCKILCKKDYTAEEIEQFATRVKEGYRGNWILDNLPAGTKQYFRVHDESKADLTFEGKSYMRRYGKGFPLGFIGGSGQEGGVPGMVYLNNHHRLVIFFHQDEKSFEGFRIVGFEVDVFSVKHSINGKWKGLKDTKLNTCTAMDPVQYGMPGQDLNPGPQSIVWTYDVKWQESDVKWASRWDLYLKMSNTKIHWLSIMNSAMVVLFLGALVAIVMLRTLCKDFTRYNEMSEMTEEEKEEETGWKLVHGDVFRPPPHAWLLSCFIGTGVQLIGMVLFTLLFATLGFLSPANRGGLMIALLVIFVCMGFVAGYNSVRLFTMFGLTNWRSNATLTAFLFPSAVFAMFFVLNLLLWGEGSTGAVPFGTLVALLAMWFGISYPLVMLGGFIASKRSVIENPTRVNNIPREIPPVKAWHQNKTLALLCGGLLPFGAIFMETFFIMSSVWQHQFYYMFGFLAMVFLILIVTCAEISIVLCYFQLCSMDYRWWWQSFFTGGTSSFYIFLYSIFYFATKAEISGFASGCLYFGYMLLACSAGFLLTGTVAFISTLWFVRKIYSVVKID